LLAVDAAERDLQEMRFSVFGGDRQVSVTQIEQKRADILAKCGQLNSDIRAQEALLVDLTEQHTSAAVERLLTQSAEAQSRDNALALKIDETMTRISGMKQDLQMLDQLTPELDSRLAAAKNRETLHVYDSAARHLEEVSGEIDDLLNQITPLITEAEPVLDEIFQIESSTEYAFTTCRSRWWELIAIALTLRINSSGNVPGLPSKHHFRKETLNDAQNLKITVRHRLQREREEIAKKLPL
jgi:hypothetical protein